MEGVLWEKDLVAAYRLDQKSQRKQEENDTGTWQQKGREEGDTKKNKPTQAMAVHTRRQREETGLQVPG